MWWWKFHSRWCIRFSLGQREANDGSEEVLPRGVPPPGIGGVGFGSSPNLAMDHTIYELCLFCESDAASFGYTSWKLEESVKLKG